MVYKLLYTSSAEQDLALLDSKVAKTIVNKLSAYSQLNMPLRIAKKLRDFMPPTYRFRIGDYRAIFRPDHTNGTVVILVILKIAHRKDIYR